MKSHPLGFIVVILTLGAAAAAQAQEPLLRVKQLYEAASYSEALAVLKTEGGAVDVVEAQTYQALCLLALGQTREAEAALEVLVMERPFATLDAATVSPRLVGLFHDVRRRIIPGATRQLYQRAKATFDAGDLEQAGVKFQEVVRLAESAEASESSSLMSDLALLADGFIRLVETSRRAAEAASAPTAAVQPPEAVTPPVEAATAAASPLPAPPADGIRTLSSPNVTPPVVIQRAMPRWPSGTPRGNYRGVLEIVVDESGAVVSSVFLERLHPAYDPLLLVASRRWRFEPARENGQPVRFRLRYPIELQADQS